ncbi:ABC transporter substrate-binding protein [Thermococcus sp. JCM 11816]|uniref:ABC transporter substrate-binding protein n=1 Tax=Thermococcus sp. (strain JCM 11816 / KS-1) TaxID=1295125 RepID=UPI000A6A849F
MKKATAVALVAIFILGLFEAGYGLAAESLPRNETLYTANSAPPPTNANPFTGGSVLGIDGLVFEPLFMFNFMTGELKPWLAESGKWVGDNVFEVKLRSGLKWQDGEPLTAEDVKFSYEYYEKIGLRNWGGDLGLKEIKVVDDRTVQFIFDGTPNYQLWQLQMFFGWGGQGALIVPKHVFENINPEDIPKMTFTGDEMKYLVGSGAYKLKEVVGQEKAILERNDDWWGGVKVFGKPGPKYIVQLYVTDNNQAANMFIKGDLDVGTYYIDIVSAKQKNPKLVSWLDKYPPYFPPVAPPVLLYFNTKHAPLDNPKVRRAIAMAINISDRQPGSDKRPSEGGSLRPRSPQEMGGR